MDWKALMKTNSYWLTNIQSDLYAQVEDYLKINNLKRKDLAEKLGVSKGYVSQVLNGGFDHKLSKLIDLCLAIGIAPEMKFSDINQYIEKKLGNAETKDNHKSLFYKIESKDASEIGEHHFTSETKEESAVIEMYTEINNKNIEDSERYG